MSNLQLRVISAVILAAIVLTLTWFGDLPFRIMAAAIGAAMFYEWSQMSASSGRTAVNQALATAAFFLAMIAVVWGTPAWIPLVLVVGGAAVTLLQAAMTTRNWWSGAGLLYAGLSAIALAYLRGGDQAGLIAILFLFAVVWATDIFAYFVGRAVGGPKLAPSISPGKTQSGAVGGAVAGVLAAVLLAWALGIGDVGRLALVALLLSAVAQAGDLFESWIKRRHGVKDSSQLIPGHGGVMDRVDGLVVAAMLLYVIGAAFSNLDQPAHGLFGG